MNSTHTQKVLKLTLKRKWFNLVASGVKREEYRKRGAWIMSRLQGKDYGLVEFKNGYGASAPMILVEYAGWSEGTGREDWGAERGESYIVIHLGRVIDVE